MSGGIAAALATTAWGVAAAVLPLSVLFLVFQIFLLDLPRSDVKRILIGTLIAAAGLFLFLLGVSVALLPFGHAIGTALGALDAKWLLLPIGLALGFATAFSEPAVRILADEVDTASNGAIRATLVVLTVCIGVSLWVGLGFVRIGYGIPLSFLLIPGYTLAIVLLWLADEEFVGIAVDAGGVTTGPVANTFLLALALGATAAAGRGDPLVNGLGLVALISLGPILSVLVLGVLVRRRRLAEE